MKISLIALSLTFLAEKVSALSFPVIKDFVSFGDSYTDETRLFHFIFNGEAAPPVGWTPEPSNATPSGGKAWPRILSENTGMRLHNYAVSGATCSNKLTPNYCPCLPTIPFPSVQEYQIPAFIADQEYFKSTLQGKERFSMSSTVFTIWIGTNDFGSNGILTHTQQPGVSTVDVTRCAVNAVERLYAAGARNFIFQNLPPLHLAPQYASAEMDGVTTPNRWWPNKMNFMFGNRTAIAEKVKGVVLAANEIYKYQLKDLASNLHGSKIAFFDTYGLLVDINENPKNYLKAPYNTRGFNHHCANAECSEFTLIDGERRDGYAWYDELHPSEQVNRVIAQEMAKTITNTSSFATWYL